MRDWTEDLTPQERDDLIEKIAQGIVKRGMQTPAILFLEMHKPLTFVASQSLVVTSPFIAPFVGIGNVQLAAKLIEKRENIELLIDRIEELSHLRSVETESGESGKPEGAG